MRRGRRTLLAVLALAFALTGLFTAAPPAVAQSEPGSGVREPMRLRGTTDAQRREAAARAAGEAAAAAAAQGASVSAAPAGVSQGVSNALPPPGGTPNYFGPEGNWAQSPLPTVDPVTGAVVAGTGIRKFVDTLPGLGPGGANNLGQFIPVANPDTVTFPGSDYYEIAVNDYNEKMHSDLPATRLRGYVQLNNGTDATGANTIAPAPHHYLGPLIVAQKDRPVRIKFVNLLPPGAGGDLFIPVDTTVMGAGMGYDPASGTDQPYTQNRATLHLHGGNTPWISDGTPHQWTTPAGEASTPLVKGVSTAYVPDMWFDGAGNVIPSCAGATTCGVAGASINPGPGMMTFFYPNQQSARLMFYHDHAYGITRLNVYAGEAAGYLLTDPMEQQLVKFGTIPATQIPLVIQDKTFVDATTVLATDPTWNWGTTPPVPNTGDLWLPHVYMPNQNPNDPAGVNPVGRWDYGPWFWPPTTNLAHGEICTPAGSTNCIPGTPNPSLVPEAFMDTPVVNGTPYPTTTVGRQAYRFRILNACNDRYLNLQLYLADPVGLTLINGGSGYLTAPNVVFSGGGATTQATATAQVTNVVSSITVVNGGAGYVAPPTVTLSGGGGGGATAVAIMTGGSVSSVQIVTPGAGYTSAPTVSFIGYATTQAQATATVTGIVTGLTLLTPGSGYTSAPTVTIDAPAGVGGVQALAMASPNTEVKMVPAVPNPTFPPTWPQDSRPEGVPDPTSAGPSWIQIGTEGGFLPMPAVIDPQPVGYIMDRRNVVVLNVSNTSLYMGPAERADVIVDFSGLPDGAKVILYNDAPAPMPAFDPRFDYFTGGPDNTATGGAPTTLPGYGPNTRTIMQFQVSGTVAGPTFNTAGLFAAFASTSGLGGVLQPGVFAASQDPILVPESTYNATYNATFTDTYAPIQLADFLTFVPMGASVPVAVPIQNKAIQELFELDYGKLNATLGVELPKTNNQIQTTIPLGYVDLPTEIINAGETQVWKITHNGVDTHAIHFHLFNVQVINRVGWDGMIRPPDANELGWKETVRMSPLEDVIVALKPVAQTLPWPIPDSVRSPDVTKAPTASWPSVDPATNIPNTTHNDPLNFGWEYVWHCHLLGHEENDMMRPIVFNALGLAPSVPSAPQNVTAVAGNAQATVTFVAPLTDGGSAILGYTVTAVPGPGGALGVDTNAGTLLGSHLMTGLTNGVAYTFTVTATNAVGVGPASLPSNSVVPGTVPDPPTALLAVAGSTQATVSFSAPFWNGGAAITGYTVTAIPGPGGAAGVDSNAGTAGTSHVVTGLTNGVSYTFTAVATNVWGTSVPSLPSNAVIPAGLPDAPTSVGATAGDAQASVTFAAPINTGGVPITNYIVTVIPGPGGALGVDANAGTTALTHVITGLTNGVSYTFTVAAVNLAGTGPSSLPSNAVTPATLPGPPTGVFAMAGDATATVVFTAPASNGGSAITGYTVTALPGPGGAAGVDTNAGTTLTAHVMTGLTNGVSYTFTVTATNAIGPSVPSLPSPAVTPAGAPAAPTIATAVPGNAQVTITITPGSANGSAITAYTISWLPADGVDASAGSNATVHTITGLTNNTQYTFTATATNSLGTSPASAPVAVWTPTVPGAPTAVTAKAGSRIAAVSFAAPAASGGMPITGYTVTSTPAGGVDTNAGSTLLTHSITGLVNGTAYSFTVVATNAIGPGPASAASNTVIPNTRPPAPSNLALASVTGTSIGMTWQDNALNETGFRVYRRTGASTTWVLVATLPANTTSWTNTGLRLNTAYSYVVRAYNALGVSPLSNILATRTALALRVKSY
jgi:FtsP/CotA-like multicopper oxidase with cupredoxin domain